MKLREYQQDAVDAVYQYLRTNDGNPIVVAPVGAGKAILLAQIAKDVVQQWNGRVLCLVHVRELVAQNADKMRRLCPNLGVGVYSAGLNRRDTNAPALVAGIQSVFKRAADLGPFDIIAVDECHRIGADDDSMYRRFLREARVVNPRSRLVGFSGTPFRMESGPIYGPGCLFDDVCYEIGLRELIARGYLCPLISKAGTTRVDTSQLNVRRGEFVAEETERLMDQDTLVESACREIVELTRDRRSVLIFSAGVLHGRHVQRVLQEHHHVKAGFVSGDTPSSERDELVARFRRDSQASLFAQNPLKFLINCQVLVEGFDSPGIDAIALLRPTMSPGLLIQMVGRGCRLFPGKENCLILDYGRNIERHGPIDQITATSRDAAKSGDAPAKECPQCHSLIAAGYTTCPDCGFAFPPPERQQHDAQATNVGILSGQVTDTKYDVLDVTYSVHTKRGAPADAPKSMRVDYRLGLDHWQSEFICFEHIGYARQKAIAWWRRRSPDPVPDTAERAVELAESGALCATQAITVRSVAGERYDRIVNYELGDKPEPTPIVAALDSAGVPF